MGLVRLVLGLVSACVAGYLCLTVHFSAGSGRGLTAGEVSSNSVSAGLIILFLALAVFFLGSDILFRFRRVE